MRLGMCCCGASAEPEPKACNTTSTVPQPWPDVVYRVSVASTFGTIMQRLDLGEQERGCKGEPNPACSPMPLAVWWWETCCGPDELGYTLRKKPLAGDTSYFGIYEFDSRGLTGAGYCDRHIPYSNGNVLWTTPTCPSTQSQPSVIIRQINQCARKITGPGCVPDFHATCIDHSEITVEFFAEMGTHWNFRDQDCSILPQCASIVLQGRATYRRAKTETDTHVAVGAYTMVSSSYPGDSVECGGTGANEGCPGTPPFPYTIPVEIK